MVGFKKTKLDSDKPVVEAAGEDGIRHSIDDPEMEGMTLYEKKCVLINREIDNNGMGKYQWYIWGLCGFGYLLDLLWAQAFGLVLGPLEQELGFSPNASGNISVGTLAGTVCSLNNS